MAEAWRRRTAGSFCLQLPMSMSRLLACDSLLAEKAPAAAEDRLWRWHGEPALVVVSLATKPVGERERLGVRFPDCVVSDWGLTVVSG